MQLTETEERVIRNRNAISLAYVKEDNFGTDPNAYTFAREYEGTFAKEGKPYKFKRGTFTIRQPKIPSERIRELAALPSVTSMEFVRELINKLFSAQLADIITKQPVAPAKPKIPMGWPPDEAAASVITEDGVTSVMSGGTPLNAMALTIRDMYLGGDNWKCCTCGTCNPSDPCIPGAYF